MLPIEHAKEFLEKYVKSVKSHKEHIPPQYFLFKIKSVDEVSMSVKYFDQTFLDESETVFWSAIVHKHLYEKETVDDNISGFIFLGVMADSYADVEANHYFGIYVYHTELGILDSYVFDFDFNIKTDIEPIDLFSDVDFEKIHFTH